MAGYFTIQFILLNISFLQHNNILLVQNCQIKKQKLSPTEISMCFSVKSSMIEPLYDCRIQTLKKGSKSSKELLLVLIVY